jgi:superfamily II DNA/RNA helicase
MSSVGSESAGNDYLFGVEEVRVPFAELSLNSKLCTALTAIGKQDATLIQAASVPPILEGKDCVIASETGSGKTMAYLVPVLDQLLSTAAKMDEDDKDDEDARQLFPKAVIMVPNKDLCRQVHASTQELLSALNAIEGEEDGEGQVMALTAEAMTTVSNVWPYFGRSRCPDVIVCTPAVVGNFVRGPVIVEPELFRSIKHLVLDEADMLLDGGYKRDLEKILDGFKVTRRQMIKADEITINDKVLQVVLSAATIPSMGELSIDKYVKKRFPRAERISNDYLHKHHPRIDQQYTRVPATDFTDTHVAAVFNALGSDYEGEPTMIFVNTADDALLLAQALRDEGLPCGELHKAVSIADRENALQAFRDGSLSLLVCTDYAARGLDLPFVRHVIQAQFALNVVQHLHRIGRASRAGRAGRATNIYGAESAELVESLLSDKDENKIDQSFSRRRGFRAKIKKARRREEGVEETEYSGIQGPERRKDQGKFSSDDALDELFRNK